MRLKLPFTRTTPEREAIKPTISADRRSAIMREGINERLATYIVRSAVHKGRKVTALTLEAYADLLTDDYSEFSTWITELQAEADDVLG